MRVYDTLLRAGAPAGLVVPRWQLRQLLGRYAVFQNRTNLIKSRLNINLVKELNVRKEVQKRLKFGRCPYFRPMNQMFYFGEV